MEPSEIEILRELILRTFINKLGRNTLKFASCTKKAGRTMVKLKSITLSKNSRAAMKNGKKK